MKYLRFTLCTLVLLAACAKGEGPQASPAPEASAAPQATAAAPITEHTQPGMTPEEYQAGMENYENMEIAFLGTVNQERSLQEVLDRAAEWKGFSFIPQIPEDRIVYGERGEFEDNVYLIIPAVNTDITVGEFNWYAGEIVEEWYHEENAKPLILVETAEDPDPHAQIRYTRHNANGTSEDAIYTGFSCMSSHLRTDYHMGTVDITPYEQFTTAEVPFMQQFFFDTLNEFEEVQKQLQQGGELHAMEEMIWDSHAYGVFDMSVNQGNTLYAVCVGYFPDAPHVMYSDDRGESWQELGRG